MQVEAGDEDDRIIDQAEEEAVGEAPDKGAAGLSMEDGVRQRSGQDLLGGSTHLPQELFAQTISRLLVPGVGLPDVLRGRWPKDVRSHRGRLRA